MFECKFKSTTTTWYRNGRRRRLTDASECLWHALKDCSDTYGAMQADEEDIAHALFSGRKGWSVSKIEACLQQLVEVGLVALYENKGQPWIQVLKHDDHQSARFIDKRADRTSPEISGNGSNSRHKTPAGNPHALSSGSGSGSGIGISSLKREESSTNEAVPARIADIRGIFDHWRKAFSKRDSTKLSEKRKARIQWALQTYGDSDCYRCIDGYANDPWEDRQKYSDLTILFRDPEHFERGLDYNEGSQGDNHGPRLSEHAARFANIPCTTS